VRESSLFAKMLVPCVDLYFKHLSVLFISDHSLMNLVNTRTAGAMAQIIQNCPGFGRVADGTMSIEEARTRHAQLLKRQHFGREPPNVRKFF